MASNWLPTDGNSWMRWVEQQLRILNRHTHPGSDSGGSATAWTAPTLQNGWVYYGTGSGMAQPGYRLVGDVVQVRGAIKSGSTGSPIFTLPVGLRPAGGAETFVVSAGPGAARVEVSWTGTVRVLGYLGGGTNAMVTLSGVSFSIL